MKKAITIVAVTILLIGLVHLALAPVIYKSLSVNAIWYAYAGIALFCLAFLNIVLINGEISKTWLFLFGHVANILYAIGIVFLIALTFAPQIILLFLLIVAETILLLWHHVALLSANSTKVSPV